MSQVLSLIKIGSKVLIDPKRIKDRIPLDLNNILSENSSGIVLGHKMTDGQGIGVIIKLKNGSKCWFFQEELKTFEEGVEDNYNKDNNVKSVYSLKSTATSLIAPSKNLIPIRDPNKEKTILYLINPFNFIEWLFYSFKDVF